MNRAEQFSPEFAQDVLDALSHYDNIAVDLGNRFRDALKASIVDIKARPESFGYTIRPNRGAMLTKFPYVIVFRVTNHLLQFGGLFHCSSDPARWEQRMRRLDAP